jgi:hypothetical protein
MDSPNFLRRMIREEDVKKIFGRSASKSYRFGSEIDVKRTPGAKNVNAHAKSQRKLVESHQLRELHCRWGTAGRAKHGLFRMNASGIAEQAVRMKDSIPVE